MKRRRRHILAAFLSSFILHPSSFAQTTQPTQPTLTFAADLGFAGVFKPDAWLPVYVRVGDDQPRAATLELRTTRGRAGHVVEARVHTSVQPTTFTLYAPPIGTLDRVTLQLRDESGRLIRELDLTQQAQATPAALGGPSFGVGGDRNVAPLVANQIFRDTAEQVAAGSVPTPLLPDRPIGYFGAFDVLVLPALNLDAIDAGTQLAIAAWVRAGGILVTWPGAQAPSGDSPLRTLLPASVGDVVERPSGATTQPIAMRSLESAATSDIRELSAGDGTIFERRVGLGQVVLCAFDPTTLPGMTDASRVDLWRRLTSNSLHLLASERRNGLFDPLVAQSRGEQQLKPPPTPSPVRPWLLAGLLVSLALGPGELVLLAAARRHPRTPFTVVGLLGTVAFTVVLIAYRPAAAATSARHVEVVLETDDGPCVTLELANRVDSTNPSQAVWLTGDRLDPAHQPAGELALAQRENGFAVEQRSLIALVGGSPAAIRSVTFAAPDRTSVAVQSNASGVAHNASGEAWNAFAIVRPDNVAESAPVPAGADVTIASPGPTTDRTAGRQKTGIEKLADDDAWAPVLIDRTIASRLVALQESEHATIRVARIDRAQGPQFIVHVTRK